MTGPNETMPPTRPETTEPPDMSNCVRCGVPVAGPRIFVHDQGPFCQKCSNVEEKKNAQERPKRGRSWLTQWIINLLR